MRKLLWNLWRKNLAFFQLATITSLEYRVNFIVDAFAQPFCNMLIEMALWWAVFKGSGQTLIGGFGQDHYLAYVIWASFIGRVAANWQYEFKMINEIDMGGINNILVRPISFYEYYLSQFMGYKTLTFLASIFIPLAVGYFWDFPILYERLPLTFLVVFVYLIFAHTMSFCIACLAFYFNRVHSMTATKNIILWLLSGEIFPIDLMPTAWKNLVLLLPFYNAVYSPVGYLVGRLDTKFVLNGLMHLMVSLLIMAFIAQWIWARGLRRYVGTGA